MCNKFQGEISKDAQMKILMDQLYNGRNDKISASSFQAHNYDLTLVDGLITK